MFLKNPRLVAIVEKIKGMSLDQLAEHIDMYNLHNDAANIIHESFAKRRGNVPEMLDLLKLISTNQLMHLRMNGSQSLEEIKRFLINHLKERENVGTNKRTDENEGDRSLEPSEPGRIEV